MKVNAEESMVAHAVTAGHDARSRDADVGRCPDCIDWHRAAEVGCAEFRAGEVANHFSHSQDFRLCEVGPYPSAAVNVVVCIHAYDQPVAVAAPLFQMRY